MHTTAPPWIELPSEITANILSRVGVIDVLESVEKVCTTWQRVCQEDPTMWRVVSMTNYSSGGNVDVATLCRQAVDRSQGQLMDISIDYFCTSQLLGYVSQRCNGLKCLRISCCMRLTGKDLVRAVQNLPKLEELHILFIPSISSKDVEAIGRLCPMLRSFTYTELNQCSSLIKYDEYALAIGRSMPGLRRLNLFGNTMTKAGLQAILDGCPELESLDLRRCFNVNLTVEKRFFRRIKDLKFPSDTSIKDYDLSKVYACFESLRIDSDPSYCGY